MSHSKGGRLILCPTPIGNLEDITLRAIRVLKEADVLFCEDTRHTGKLLSHHGIKPRKLISYHKFNEAKRRETLAGWLQEGALVALCSDAGSPALSDPGADAVKTALEGGYRVEALPGPQAIIPALTASGLPCESFIFLGFMPRRKKDRIAALASVSKAGQTLIWYEAPGRLSKALKDVLQVLGDRPAAVARELSKLHESVHRGSVAELERAFSEDPPLGELVLLVGGYVAPEPAPEALGLWVRSRLQQGATPKEIAAEATKAGYRRNEAYETALKLNNKG